MCNFWGGFGGCLVLLVGCVFDIVDGGVFVVRSVVWVVVGCLSWVILFVCFVIGGVGWDLRDLFWVWGGVLWLGLDVSV